MIRLRVKEVAEEKGLSRTKLSQRSEVSYNVIKRMFNDPLYPISTDILERVAKVLGVSVKDLIEELPD